ncbi:hypothetical protein [Flavobacterium sp. LB2P44]|uniref:hypothetical protein n=1 Tax=Flavobacterium sp. LB2P44 TaxID=3401713 RepID=UPI003AAEC806
MELYKVEQLLEKYFDGETTIQEERDLQDYFLSEDVAPHLAAYKLLFEHFAATRAQQFEQEMLPFEGQRIPHRDRKQNVVWLSIAASVAILLGVGSYVFYNSESVVSQSKDLGTYDDPKVALKATQKALSLLSNKVNVGIETVQYIEEYEITKNKVFINTERKSGGI